MIVDANELESGSTIQCDLCIIGAGAAGITLAREFDGSGLNVWLLESGGFKEEAETQSLYKGASTGRTYHPLDRARLRFLGGTTNHWSGYCRPLDEMDFKKRDWIDYSGWPFEKEHLRPWYKLAQIVCELDDFSYDAADAMPANQKPSPFSSGTIKAKLYQRSPPTRFGKAYRKQIRGSKNITVCLHANVTNLQADNPPVKLKHLKVETLHNKQFKIRAKITVLACGSIENSRLLLASNDIENNGLGNHHDLVGRFFMDHLIMLKSGALLSTVGRMSYYWYSTRYKSGRKLPVPTLLLDDSTQRALSIGNYSVMLRPPPKQAGEISYRYLERKIGNETKIDNLWQHLGNILSDADDVTSMLYYRYAASKNKPILLPIYSQWEQTPNPESRITLSSEIDKLGSHRAQLDWRLSKIDEKTLLEGQLALAREFGRLGIGRLRTDINEENPLSDKVVSDHHQLGTTRMHDSPKHGVVDADCRLHSVNNLFIAGGSVFPTVGSANPTLTVVALALRLANHLKEKLA